MHMSVGGGEGRAEGKNLKQTPCWAWNLMQGSISWPWDHDLMKNQKSDAWLPEPPRHPYSCFKKEITKYGQKCGEISLTVPQKVKHRGMIQPCNSIHRHIPKRNGNTSTIKLVVITSSFVLDSQHAGTTQMSINWWKYKENVVYPYGRKWFSHKGEQRTDVLQHGWTLKKFHQVR